MENKVLIFGIDGGTLDVIHPMVEKGKLPNIAKLFEEGVYGDLHSTIHPITPSAWSSFATGKNPGKHGIYDFSSPHPDHYGFKLSSASDRKAKSFWSLLGKSDKKVIVLNIPFTFPPENVNGIMISGFDAPGASRLMAYPREIYDELVAEFGSYSPDWTFPIGKKYNLEKYRSEVVSTIKRRTETSLYLLKKYPWDLFITVFNSVDHIQHVFFGMGKEGMEIIEEGYELVDKALGSFLEEIGDDTTIFIMSDHGAGEIKKFFYLDQWLEKEGWLCFRKNAILKDVVQGFTKKGRFWLKRILPVGVRGYLRGRLPGVRDFVATQTSGHGIEWPKTHAYSSGMYGNIYINLKGREKGGIVEEVDYQKVCDDIITKLLELKDPTTGEKVIEKVYKKEDLYHGPYITNAPDLVIQWKDYAYFTKKGIDKKGDIFGDELKLDSSDYPHTGTHRLNGIFMAKGPSIIRGKKVEGIDITDLAPNILFYMGETVPDDMDGEIKNEIFVKSFLEKNTPIYHKPSEDENTETGPMQFTPAEEAEMAERLKSLGYIE